MIDGMDLSGVDPSHRPGLAVDNIFPGLVYCMVCGRLLTSSRALQLRTGGKGLTPSGRYPCSGPLGVQPCRLIPIEASPASEVGT